MIISLLLGLFYAELVNHRFPGRGIVRTMLITPFLVMPVAGALGWKNMMMDPDFGVINWLIRAVQPGSGSWNPVWLAHYPRQSIVIMLVWRWAPFMMLILLAGMQSIDEEVREAARVDGATAGAGVHRHHPAPSLPLHAARRAARHGLHRPGNRPDLHDDPGRPGHADDEPSVLVYETAIRG